jgi:hypothetical protein
MRLISWTLQSGSEHRLPGPSHVTSCENVFPFSILIKIIDHNHYFRLSTHKISNYKICDFSSYLLLRRYRIRVFFKNPFGVTFYTRRRQVRPRIIKQYGTFYENAFIFQGKKVFTFLLYLMLF